ncbi:uncharacterized protein LOC111341584 [Stylophora pistillata]|nr:uncharacterized protein LOC111341584 [Stylophora pistillata]
METQSVFVLATVLSMRDKFCYPCCTRCRKKVHTRENELTFWCERCREMYRTESVQYRYRISVMAADRTQLGQVTVFGSCLDRFFGTTATSFMRLVTSLSTVPSTIPWSRVVYQAMEQCFVGSLLHFGFRVSPPCRRGSKISHSSPVNLKNIVRRIPKPDKTSHQAGELPSLLACQVLPSSEQSPTVMQILKEYENELKRITTTPHPLSPIPSQHSLLLDSQTSYKLPECFSSNKRASSIYCSPHEFGSMNAPLVLTGFSQSPSDSAPTSDSGRATNNKERRKLQRPLSGEIGSSLTLNDKGNGKKLHISNQMQSGTPGILLNTNPNEDLRDLHLSAGWQEYDDFPSSEDLSAFLADLEKDDRQSLQALNSEKPASLLQSLYPDATFGEVVNECCLLDSSRSRDYREFTDFPSSEDLDVFLADMELDYGSVLIRKPLTPKITTVSTAQRDDIVSSRADHSPCLDDTAYSSEASDSQFLRDCETVFAELTGNNSTENVRVESKSVCVLPESLIPNKGREQNHAEETGEYDINRTTPGRFQHKNKTHDRITLTDLKVNQTSNGKCISSEHCGYSDVSMSNDSCDIFSTVSLTPDLFTQSLCSSERGSGTPDLSSSPTRKVVKFHSRCANHNMTPNSSSFEGGFRDCTNSCSVHELNSMSLFSSSDTSFISPVSSPLRRTGQGASCPSSAQGNEAASLPNVGHADVGNDFDTDSVAASFHSTPYNVFNNSKLVRKSWSTIQVSPLSSNSGSKSRRDVNCQGTPVLFSQVSNSSF